MEKNIQETHDFMNVESFSQLPFICPTHLKEKGIRLFGKEFSVVCSGSGSGSGSGSSDSLMITDTFDSNDTRPTTHDQESKEMNESSRKFECHYCCRNFPTSQALGGHQNAHKRERQHAKRAHLQSTMVRGTFSEAQMNGLMNYHRFATSTTTPPPYYHHTTTNLPLTNYNNRFYGNSSYMSYQTPINGSPLGLWRYPNAQTTTFNGDNLINASSLVLSNEGLRASRIPTSSSFMYDSKPSVQVQDQVSLDLHL